MITGEIYFQIWAQDNNTFRMILKKFRQKWLVKKSKFVWRKKKPTSSTNIPLLSYRKSEQQGSYIHTRSCMWVPVMKYFKYTFLKIDLMISSWRLYQHSIYTQFLEVTYSAWYQTILLQTYKLTLKIHGYNEIACIQWSSVPYLILRIFTINLYICNEAAYVLWS